MDSHSIPKKYILKCWTSTYSGKGKNTFKVPMLRNLVQAIIQILPAQFLTEFPYAGVLVASDGRISVA